jgi:hypothetical protein
LFLLIFIPLALKELRIKREPLRKYLNILCNLGFTFGVLIGLLLSLNYLIDANTFPLVSDHNVIDFLTALVFVCSLILLQLNPSFKIKIKTKNQVLSIIFLLTLLLTNHFMDFLSKNQNTEDKAWIDMQYWTRQNIGKYESVIVPPYKPGFRIYSKRSIYGDWKDGTLGFFSHMYAFDWFKRMNEIGVYNSKKSDQAKAYNNLTKEKILLISDNYNQQFIVFENSKQIDFLSLYKNSHYTLYKIGITQ